MPHQASLKPSTKTFPRRLPHRILHFRLPLRFLSKPFQLIGGIEAVGRSIPLTLHASGHSLLPRQKVETRLPRLVHKGSSNSFTTVSIRSYTFFRVLSCIAAFPSSFSGFLESYHAASRTQSLGHHRAGFYKTRDQFNDVGVFPHSSGIPAFECYANYIRNVIYIS